MRPFMKYIGRRRMGEILEFDFEEAYAKVKWPFLQQAL
jgi:hypothetical protein